MSDQESIVKQIRAALEQQPRAHFHRHPLGIHLNPDASVMLEGEVADVAAKKIALESAARVPGVAGIIDRVRVAPSERMGDGEIRNHVRDAFVGEPALATCAVAVCREAQPDVFRVPEPASEEAIEIAVNDGIVTLNGRVRSLAQKRLAGVLAWWVRGTRDVINGIEVSPPQEDSDNEITEAVRIALEKDPLVEAGEIRVKTRNAVVALEGLIKNAQERRAAENDAWCTFGVDGVDNRLEMRE